MFCITLSHNLICLYEYNFVLYFKFILVSLFNHFQFSTGSSFFYFLSFFSICFLSSFYIAVDLLT